MSTDTAKMHCQFWWRINRDHNISDNKKCVPVSEMTGIIWDDFLVDYLFIGDDTISDMVNVCKNIAIF